MTVKEIINKIIFKRQSGEIGTILTLISVGLMLMGIATNNSIT